MSGTLYSYNVINPYPNNQAADQFARRISRPLNAAHEMPTIKLERKIGKIIEYKNTLPRKKQMYADIAIHNLKKIIHARPNEKPRLARRSHKLTDHGFCRILEIVCEKDMIALKDLALKKLKDSGFEPIFSPDGMIVSIQRDGVEP